MQSSRTRWLAGAALLLGTFLVATAVLAQVYAVPKLVRVPLDVDVTNQLEGTGTLGGESHKIRVTNTTKADADASDEDYIVWVDGSCIVKGEGEDTPGCVSAEDPEGRLLDASEERYVSHRHTGLGTDDPKYVNGKVQAREGLVGKFPFGSEKKSYEIWDGMLEKPVTATYEGEEKLDGLQTYRYQILFEDEPAEVLPDTEGLYSLERHYWIEPVTGAVMKVTTHEVRSDEAGEVLVDIDIAYTDKTVAMNIADAKGNRLLLVLAQRIIPIVGYGVGGLLLLLGAASLLLGRRRTNEDAAYGSLEAAPVP